MIGIRVYTGVCMRVLSHLAMYGLYTDIYVCVCVDVVYVYIRTLVCQSALENEREAGGRGSREEPGDDDERGTEAQQ